MNNETEQIFIVNSSDTTAVPKIGETAISTQANADFSTVCRTCATVTEFVIPIFDGEGLHNNLADKIHKHLPIQVTVQDVLPLVVCYQCASTLLAWHELVQCCEQADAALRARLQPGPGLAESELNSTNAIQNSEQEQQQKWESCSVEVKPDLRRYGGTVEIERDDDYKNYYDCDIDPDTSGSCGSGNEDDKPLSKLANEKAADLYGTFYRALLKFRNHFAEKHDLQNHRDSGSADTSDSETSSERNEPDANVDSYDDLSHCNMRRDRMDEATRLELDRVRTRVGGKAYYTCGDCGKRLSSPHTYVFHRRIHSGARPCVCHVCGKQFRAPHALRRHLTETHERAKRHACPSCGRTFANSQNLKQHARIHTGERPYACAQCGKRFAQSGSLHAHGKTHSALLPHGCRWCGARFRLRAGLVRHELRHSGERPHACPQCAKAFKLRHELAAHLLSHTNARPFACGGCPATFRQRRAARQHARTHHAPPLPPQPLHAPLPAPPLLPQPGPAYAQLENY